MLRIIAIWFIILVTFPVIADTALYAEAPKYEKGNKKNPFIPIVTNEGQIINVEEEDKEASLVLEGIIYDKEGQSMAIINGQIIRKNDTIQDAKIVEVRKDSVVYVKDGEIFILEAKKEGGL